MKLLILILTLSAISFGFNKETSDWETVVNDFIKQSRPEIYTDHGNRPDVIFPVCLNEIDKKLVGKVSKIPATIKSLDLASTPKPKLKK